MVLIVRDFNAGIEREDTFRPTIGIFNIHNQCNNSGHRLEDFSIINNLLIRAKQYLNIKICSTRRGSQELQGTRPTRSQLTQDKVGPF